MSEYAPQPPQFGGADASSFRAEETARRDHQITNEVLRLRDEVEQIHGEITELETRLNPVLREPVDSVDKEVDPRQQLVPLAEELRSSGLALNAARFRLVSIRERLEL